MTLATAIQSRATAAYRPLPRSDGTRGTPALRAAAAAYLHRARKRFALTTADGPWAIACKLARAEVRLAWRDACRASEA